jgi:hypothetical protein
LSAAPDADRTWLADTSPLLTVVDESALDGAVLAAVTAYPKAVQKVAELVALGPDTVPPEAARTLLAKLKADFEGPAPEDRWNLQVRLLGLAIDALLRRGQGEAHVDEIFTAAQTMISALQRRSDWLRIRDAIYNMVMTRLAALPSTTFGDLLGRLFAAAAERDRRFVEQVATMFLASLTFEERAPIWGALLRMRSVL